MMKLVLSKYEKINYEGGCRISGRAGCKSSTALLSDSSALLPAPQQEN